MKHRFYLIDIANGRIHYTNEEDEAANCSASEEFFVIDTDFNQWMIDGEGTAIPPTDQP